MRQSLLLAFAGAICCLMRAPVLAHDAPPDRAPGERTKTVSPAERPGAELDPREFLRLRDLDERQLEKFIDGEPLGRGQRGQDELKVLAQLLYAVQGIDVQFVERWAKQSGEFPGQDLARNSTLRRGQFFTIRGHVTRVAEEHLPPELAERLDIKKLFRCTCEVGDDHASVIVYALTVPMAWATDRPLRAPVSFQGVYFKLSGGRAAHPHTPTFAAARLGWHPDNLLGRLGFDAGLLDGVAHYTKHRTADDHDAFYQLLAGAGRAASADIDAAAEDALARLDEPPAKPGAARQFSIPQLFEHAKQVETQRREQRDLQQLGEAAHRVLALTRLKNAAKNDAERSVVAGDLQEALGDFQAKAQTLAVPADVAAVLDDLDGWIRSRLADSRQKLIRLADSPYGQGQPMTFEGTALRALRVRVDEPALQERFGLDHYYAVIAFVDLGRSYQLEESGLTINTAPVYACLRELPGDMPLGDRIHERVRFSGVFLKVFPYTPKSADQAGVDAEDLAPLLIGRDLTWMRAERQSHAGLALFATGLFIAALGGIALWSWRARRADARARAKLLRRSGPGSLDRLELD